MYFHFYILTLVVMVTYAKSGGKADIKALDMILESLGGGGAGGSSSSSSSSAEGSAENTDMSKELKKYFKHMADMEQKHYKKLMKEQISDEEKDEVKYFADMLEKIKALNRDM